MLCLRRTYSIVCVYLLVLVGFIHHLKLLTGGQHLQVNGDYYPHVNPDIIKLHQCPVYVLHSIFLRKTKRQHLLTLQVSGYCVLYIISITVDSIKYITDSLAIPVAGELCPSKHNTLKQCWLNGGPSSTTLGQH